MWQYLGYTALEVANQRTREAQDNADRWRLLHATDAGANEPAARPGVGRRVAAVALRRFSDASLSVGEAACAAAARLEHRTA